MLNLQYLLNKGYSKEDLSKLDELSLPDNEIETIDVKLFETFSNLTKLILHNNKLTKIDAETFKKLPKLTTLSLNNNLIESIDEKAFEGCSNLTELYLHDNKINHVYRNTFEALNSIQIVSIFNNNNQIGCLSFYDRNLQLPSWIENLENNLNEKGYFSDLKQFLDQFGKIFIFIIYWFKITLI